MLLEIENDLCHFRIYDHCNMSSIKRHAEFVIDSFRNFFYLVEILKFSVGTSINQNDQINSIYKIKDFNQFIHILSICMSS